MRIGSLFSGAGGLDLAVEAVFGAETAWHCEIDPAASKVLAARWPSVPNLGDITAVDWSTVEPIDVLCGGFPCQDVSAAGRRAGIREGTRSGLWAIFADAIAALRPSTVVVENVRGLLSAEAHRAVESADATVGDGSGRPVLRAAGAVLGDLADLGYDAVWATVAAASVGAPHKRERVFIVAHPPGDGWPRLNDGTGRTAARDGRQRFAAGSDGHATITNASRDGRDEGWPESAGVVGRSDVAVGGSESVALLPTPSVADSAGGHLTRSGARSTELLLPGVVQAYATGDLLPTPRSSDCFGPGRHGDGGLDLRTAVLAAPSPRPEDEAFWGKYESAIRRWEMLTRPAPAPTEPNTKGNPRLSAAFSEWMIGYPAGWITNVGGISRNDQLRIIGNSVVPQQAASAILGLLNVYEVAA